MFRILEGYAKFQSSKVYSELLSAAPIFDQQEYYERILKNGYFLSFLQINDTNERSELIYFSAILNGFDTIPSNEQELIMLIEDYRRHKKLDLRFSTDKIQKPIQKSSNSISGTSSLIPIRHNSLQGQSIKLFNRFDAERISTLKELAHLRVGRLQEGTLSALARSCKLQSLGIFLDNCDQLIGLDELQDLRTLILSGTNNAPFTSNNVLDLSILSQCKSIEKLVLFDLGDSTESNAARISLTHLKELVVIRSPTGFLSSPPPGNALRKIALLSQYPAKWSLNLQGFKSLISIDVSVGGANTVIAHPPESVRRIGVWNARNFHIPKPDSLPDLTHIYIGCNIEWEGVMSIVGYNANRSGVYLKTTKDIDPAFNAKLKKLSYNSGMKYGKIERNEHEPLSFRVSEVGDYFY